MLTPNFKPLGPKMAEQECGRCSKGPLGHPVLALEFVRLEVEISPSKNQKIYWLAVLTPNFKPFGPKMAEQECGRRI